MTINELIAILQKFNPNKRIVINDADTNWYLDILKIEEFRNVVTIRGDYSDRYDDE